jgi:quinoprotein glucose dehydrogenase
LLAVAGVVVGGTAAAQKSAAKTKAVAKPAAKTSAAQNGDWPMYQHDPASTRYSPLTQINTANVADLKQAWVYHLVKDAPVAANAGAPTPGGRMRNSEATPIMADGLLYMPTPYGTVIALDPETGKEVWNTAARAPERGVSYWPGDKAKGSPAAIIFGAAGGKMVSLDAKTGQPTPGFGVDGAVDIRSGVMNDSTTERSAFNSNSPFLIVGNIVVTGSQLQESPAKGTWGDVRGWDAHDGHLLWTFHTVPRPGEEGYDTWAPGTAKDRSGTNAWGFMSADMERGLVYFVTGSPSADFYGGDREGKNLFANSLVAVHTDTGKMAWYFQAIHHDITDYDLQSAPILFDVKQDGKTIPSLGFTSKSGMVFILDRTNGKPIYGVNEMPVPPSEIPGEKRWPTQPVPVKPEPLGLHHYDPVKDGVSTVTPEHEAFCKNMVENSDPAPAADSPQAINDLPDSHGAMVGGGPFIPFGKKLTILFPGTLGALNWHGMSYDPNLGYLFVNVSNIADVGKIVKNPRGPEPAYVRTSPWGLYARFWEERKFWPCQPGPWGELMAINVNTGDVAWREPFGTIPELEAKGVTGTGSLSFGGTIATAGGLIFIAGTNDHHFRAFDSKTGKTLWDTKMDTGAYVVPLTYLGKDGKQYVVIVDTGGSYYDHTTGDQVLAFALDQPAGKSASK